ncbi:hypothetical protein CRG98_032880 [Punica granatum]|uniref:Reverse transcriptase domain-containing protein n=1 Tax=Punica granatum TaxID=22663 RepID=A0A2I0ISY7_PUNGR|nr:hypothetical protein CRG98_032880 [Punica granatum]
MKTTRARKGWVTMKIDRMKAFDKLEWSFIITVLRQFGFHDKFFAWIHQCISISAMSILINGSPHGYFSPKRGLRQGDPISLYLFIISMEILSHLMYRAKEQGAIRGIQIYIGASKISHLMFANDLLILVRATTTNTNNVKNILDKFYSWSGQEVNLTKSGVYFSKNTPAASRRDIKDAMGMKKLKEDSRYLGNPSFKPIPSIGIQAEPDTKVRDLMLFHPKRWNTPMLLSLFDQGTDALQTYSTAFAASDALSRNTIPVSHRCLILSPIRELAPVKRKQTVSLKSGTSYTLMLHGPQRTLAS